MIAYATLSTIPDLSEIAAMWPFWLIVAALATLYFFCEWQDSREWDEYRERQRRSDARRMMEIRKRDHN